jgi:hypothetical protein
MSLELFGKTMLALHRERFLVAMVAKRSMLNLMLMVIELVM